MTTPEAFGLAAVIVLVAGVIMLILRHKLTHTNSRSAKRLGLGGALCLVVVAAYVAAGLSMALQPDSSGSQHVGRPGSSQH